MKGMRLEEFGRFLGKNSSRTDLIQGYAFDSRSVKAGEVFFALPGKKVDGHQFLEDVAQKKILAAVVSQEYRGPDFGLELFPVPDVREALQDLAKIAFSKRKEKVIGVTGSVGKTTTKEFIASLLEKEFLIQKTLGSANSQVSLPLFLLNLPQDKFDFLVIEMGMSEPKELENLVQIAPPDIVVITKIALQHSRSFPEGLPAIARAKAEILSHKRTSLVILNHQVIEFKEVQEKLSCPYITYALESDHVEDIDFQICTARAGYIVKEKGKASPAFSLSFNASHLIEDFLAAAIVARTCGMSWASIAKQAPFLSAYALRYEVVQREGVTFVNDCYNASPESMKAALMNLPEPAKGRRKIAVFGSMTELGKFAKESHAFVANLAHQCGIEKILCIGIDCQIMIDLFSNLGKSAKICDNISDIRNCLFSEIQSGDVVLIKGSKGHELWKVLNPKG